METPVNCGGNPVNCGGNPGQLRRKPRSTAAETPVNCGGNPGQLRRFEYEPTFALPLPLPLQGGGGAGGGTPSWSPTACPCLTKISKSAQMEDQMRTGVGWMSTFHVDPTQLNAYSDLIG